MSRITGSKTQEALSQAAVPQQPEAYSLAHYCCCGDSCYYHTVHMCVYLASEHQCVRTFTFVVHMCVHCACLCVFVVLLSLALAAYRDVSVCLTC